MENSKKFIVGYIIVFIVLVGMFIYPGLNYFQKAGTLFRILGFLGLIAYITYINLELYNTIRRKDQQQSDNSEGEEEERRFTDFFLNIADPNEKYHQLTNKLIKTVKQSLVADSSFFYLYNPQENYYRLQHFQSDTADELNEIIDGNAFYDDLRASAVPRNYAALDLSTNQLFHYPQALTIKSMMIVPLLFGGFIGFVGVDSREKDAWGDHDLELLTEYTNIITQFISQLDNMENLNRKIDFLQELEELNLSIQSEQDLNSVYREYTTLIEKYLSYDKLSIISYSINGDNSGNVDFIDGVETDYTVGFQFDIRNTLCERIIDSNKFFIKNYDESEIAYRFKPNDFQMLPFKSAIGIPMTVNKNIKTCMILESFTENEFSESDYLLLKNICSNLENTCRKNFEYKTVKDLSMIDSLTKLFNHKALKDQLKYEIERSKRYDTRLTYLMIDIDKFKSVNDESGHLFGDYVLKKIAQIITASVRKIDIVGRYGGEEFGVILVNTDNATSINTAERIRSNIENFIFEYDGKRENITISIGLAEFPKHGDDFHNIIANADQAMYKVKELDGNKVKMYKA